MATYPGVISTHSQATIVRNIEDHLVDQIVEQLKHHQPTRTVGEPCPGDRDIVFRGSFEDVNRLFCRNVLRLLPGTTDMATFGQMFRAVVPENDQACADMGWQPLHVTRGFRREDSVVTLTSVRAVSDPFSTAGEHAESHLEYIVDWVKRMIHPYQAAEGYVETNVLLLTPIIASIIAKAGYSKQMLNDYIMKHAMVSAREFERLMTLGNAHPPGTTLRDLVRRDVMPPAWAESDDPQRLVPLMLPETQWLVVVTGDPTRNRCCVFRQNFKQGYATSRKIELPARWDALLARAGAA